MDWRSHDGEVSLVPKTIVDNLLVEYGGRAVPANITVITAAVTGYDSRFFGNRFREELRNNTDPASTFQLSSLAEASHAGAFVESDGILLRCGHGASAFTKMGRHRAITGGWGALVGDEGSGIWLGYRAVACITALHDRVASPLHGELAEEILKRLGSKDDTIQLPDAPTLLEDLHLKRLMRSEREWKKRLYDIGLELLKIAESKSPGAEAAVQILDEGHQHLISIVSGGLRYADLRHTSPFDICLTGSLFRSPYYTQMFKTKLVRYFPGARITPAKYSPVMGIALLALQDSAKPLDYLRMESFVSQWGAEPWAKAIPRI
jgi:N-acetylglucosamine kinase-like BadF-type ATPase